MIDHNNSGLTFLMCKPVELLIVDIPDGVLILITKG